MDWHSAKSNRQAVIVGSASVLLHLVAFLLALNIPGLITERLPERIVVEHHTPLYFPRELTQKAPNHGKVSKEIDLASLAASQQEQQRQQASPNPSVRHFEPPQNVGIASQNTKTPRIMPDAPNLAMNQNPADPGAGAINGLTPAPPPPNTNNSQFSNAGAQAPPKVAPSKVPPPPGTLKPGASQENQSIPSPAAPDLPGQIGNQHLGVQLLSDPQSADFKKYLERILAIVRANWQRVMPESVRQGHMRGSSVIQFVINRDGTIARVSVVEPSGVNQLDFASSTSIVMSNPLPQLPADFKGYQVKVAYKFDYNMPTQ